MADFQAYITALKNAVAADLPARLVAASLTAFDEYTDDTPRRPDIRQLGFFQGVMEHSMEREEDEILIHATLLGTENPTPYIGPIIASLRSVDPEIVGKQTLEVIEVLPLYAGMPPEGADRAWLQFSLTYTKELDGCDFE